MTTQSRSAISTRLPLLVLALATLGLLPVETAQAGDHSGRHRSGPRPVRFERDHRARHDHARDCTSAVRCTCRRTFEPGHYETVCETVVVPGHYEKVWVPACYEARVVLGCRISVQVGGGHHKKVWHPAREERVERRILVEGRWVTSGACSLHPPARRICDATR